MRGDRKGALILPWAGESILGCRQGRSIAELPCAQIALFDFADGSDTGPDGSDAITLGNPPMLNINQLRRETAID